MSETHERWQVYSPREDDVSAAQRASHRVRRPGVIPERELSAPRRRRDSFGCRLPNPVRHLLVFSVVMSACARSTAGPPPREVAAKPAVAPAKSAASAPSSVASAAPSVSSIATAAPIPEKPPQPSPKEVARVCETASAECTKKSIEYGSSYWKCTPATCAKLVGKAALAAVGACAVECEEYDQYASIEIATWCGVDICDGKKWIVSGGHPVVEAPYGGTYVVFDGRYVIADGTAPGRRSLTRIDLTTGKSAPFGACTSPNLSPSDKWVVCLDSDAALLRIPATGGASETVAEQPAGTIIPWSFDRNWPAPTFPDDTHVDVIGLGVIPWKE